MVLPSCLNWSCYLFGSGGPVAVITVQLAAMLAKRVIVGCSTACPLHLGPKLSEIAGYGIWWYNWHLRNAVSHTWDTVEGSGLAHHPVGP